MNIKAILFDLDGTLLDTAPDLVYAVNVLREAHRQSPLDLAVLRPYVGLGAKAMLKFALGVDEYHPQFKSLRQQLFDVYASRIAQETQLFAGVPEVLTYIQTKQIPWGIVTNKLTEHTQILLRTILAPYHPQTVVCGDTLTTIKPDPAPLLYGCDALHEAPAHTLFVGDAYIDVKAAQAAGTPMLVALYGYIGQEMDPYSWPAVGYVKDAKEIIAWL